jgi:hypothetical protein
MKMYELGYCYPFLGLYSDYAEFLESRTNTLMHLRNLNLEDDWHWWLFENELKMNDSNYKKLGEYL